MERATEFTCDVGDDGIISTPGIYAMLRNIFARFKGKRILISVRLYREKRSNKQNAYYRGVVVPYVREMFAEHGNDWIDDEIHEYLKEHVGRLIKTITDLDGNRTNIVRSSTSLTTVEWEDFMEKVRCWAAEHHCIIPLPNEEVW